MSTCEYHSQPETNHTWLDSTCFLSFELAITTLKAAPSFVVYSVCGTELEKDVALR